MHWNLFSTWTALMIGGGLIYFLLIMVEAHLIRRHELRMAKLKYTTATLNRKEN